MLKYDGSYDFCFSLFSIFFTMVTICTTEPTINQAIFDLKQNNYVYHVILKQKI